MVIRPSNCRGCLSLLLLVLTLVDWSLAFQHCHHCRVGLNRISISHAERSSGHGDLRRRNDRQTFAFRRRTLTTGSNTVRAKQLSAIIDNEKEPYDERESISIQRAKTATAVWIFGILPALSLAFPLLLHANLLIPLFIAKRIYIYLLAVTVVIVASRRGATEDSPLLGTRVVDLTRDIVPSFALLQQQAGNEKGDKEDERFQELQMLDGVEGSAQAVGLPLLVVSSLVVSLFFVLLQNTDLDGSSTRTSVAMLPIWKSIQSVVPLLINLSNALVVTIFARAELKRALDGVHSDTGSLIGALGLSALAYLGPWSWVWPIQNLLCMCLAMTVARAIQLPRMGPILLALTGLVAYDVLSVGVQLVNLGSEVILAQNQGDAVSPAVASSSAMGAVALSKAGLSGAASTIWQPGLFQVRIRGAVSDLLGLGDAVFPALLSTFCLRFDQRCKRDTGGKEFYFGASIFGFALGCIACEFAPGVDSTGLPALLFLVPFMLTTVVGTAIVRGDVSSLWTFDAESPREGDVH